MSGPLPVLTNYICFVKVFEGLAWSLSELDVLLSFADLAAGSPNAYTRPIITPPVRVDHSLRPSLQKLQFSFSLFISLFSP